MAACMSALRRSRIFGDLTTYCRINAVLTTLKREKADIPKPKFNKDGKGNKLSVCVAPFPRVLDIDPAVDEACENPLRDLKRHQGIMTPKPLPLPDLLTYNARLLLAEKQLLNNTVLEQEVKRLHNVFLCRQPPMEKTKVTNDLQQIFESNYMDLLSRGIDPSQLDDKRKRHIELKSLDTFYKTHQKWTKMEFDAKTGLIYMAARLAPNFRVLQQIFHEKILSECQTDWILMRRQVTRRLIWIQTVRKGNNKVASGVLKIHKRDSSFLPTSIYNFGSGLGTVVWAADLIWGNKVFEYYNVDESPAMNELARKLLARDMDTLSSSIKGVNFRQFPLSDDSNVGSFKMVVSAYTLMDQPNRLARLRMVDSLWKLTDNYLVLVEHGTTAGHKLIMEARDFILKNQGKLSKGKSECHVFAPCTHDEVCPKLELHKAPCYLTTEYKPLNTGKEYGQGLKNRTNMYTYVVIKKGARKEAGHSYPRFLSIEKKKGYSECELCCRDGTMRSYNISNSKPSKMVHLATRKSASGDFLPVNWPSKDEMKAYEFDPEPPKPKPTTLDSDTKDAVQVAVESENVVDEAVTGEFGGELHSEDDILQDAIGELEQFEEKGGLLDDDLDQEYDSGVYDEDRVQAEAEALNNSTKTFEELMKEADRKKLTKNP